jgi:gas vesicle protein
MHRTPNSGFFLSGTSVAPVIRALCVKRRKVKIETIFYMQLASVIGFIAALFILYRVLVSQKDASIQLLKEKCDYLTRQLNDTSKSSPDALAKSLSNRVKLLDDEIGRLSIDKENNQEQIKQKEKELDTVKEETEELSRKIAKAHDLIKEFFCPKCGSPMAERAYQSEYLEYQGEDFEIDHEYVAYECGYALVDRAETSSCTGNEASQS